MRTKILRTVALITVAGAVGWAVNQKVDEPQDGAKPGAEPPAISPAAVADANPGAAMAESPAPPAAEKWPALSTNAAPAGTNAPPPTARVVQNATPPTNLKLSPGLAEVVKMVQAGVSEDVLLAYVANSTNIFEVESDAIVYLNDLGVSSSVITTLIQHDAAPETMARRQAAVSANPLPPEIVLKSPATNIYPSTVTAPAPNLADVPGSTVYSQPVSAPVPEPQPVEATQTVYVTQQVTTVSYFYDSLAPYGNWVSVPEYGLCWQPTVAVIDYSWRPYSDNGRWIWSDSGWYWYSGYSWGWAPFHYGRWCSYPRHGWLWIPDTCWGPSWVTWRHTPYYSGWAPLPPSCHYVNGFGLYYGGGSVGVSFGFGYDYGWYTFMPTAYFCHPNPHHYYVPYNQARAIYKDSVVVNNYVVGNNNTIINNGIGLDRVARVHRGDVPKATVRDTAFTTSHNVRLERLEHRENGLAVVRPTLPKQPPINPTLLAARTQADPTKAIAARESAPRPTRTARTDNRMQPGAAMTPTTDTHKPAAPLQSPRAASEPARPYRPRGSDTLAQIGPDALPTSRMQPPSATPERSVPGSPAPSRVEPERPNRPATPSSSTSTTRSPTVRPTPQQVPGASSPAPAPARPQRPELRSDATTTVRPETFSSSRPATTPPAASRPSRPDPAVRPSAPGSPSFAVRPEAPRVYSAPPRAVAPAMPAPAMPAPRSMPSPPMRTESFRSAPAPSAPAPSVSAPAPPPSAPASSAPASSGRSGGGGGGGGGGGSRPGRPNR